MATSAPQPHGFGLANGAFPSPVNDRRPTTESVTRVKHQSPLTAALLTLEEIRRRDRAFGSDCDIFREPAWRILVDLFVESHRRRQVTVSSACIASGVAATTALRCTRLLETRGMVRRIDNPRDRRSSLLCLTAEAEEMLNAYFGG